MVTVIKPITHLPTEDELPYDDNEVMETYRHKLQMDILLETLQSWLDNREDGFIGGNMFIYFSTAQLKNQDYKGPDFFAVLGVEKRERKSWVVWEEGKGPDVIIELLSESTAKEDKTNKKLIYQNQLRVPNYFWYDPFNPDDFAGFTLENGVYQPLIFDQQQRLLSPRLNLKLLRWTGKYRGIETTWLRWITLDGRLLPTGEELAQEAENKAQQAETKAQEAENKAQQAETKAQQAETKAQQAETKAQQAETKAQQAEQEAELQKAKAKKLAAKLKELGIDPETII